MEFSTIAALIAGAAGLGVLVWLLAKIGKALLTIAEALATAAVVFLALWLVIKAVWWALRQAFTHWRMSLTMLGMLTWGQCWGWPSLMITAGVLTGALAGWRLFSVRSFDTWAGRWLRAWWLRWSVYAPKLPDWLHACGLGTTHDPAPVLLALTPFGRALGRARRPTRPSYPGCWRCARARPGMKSKSGWWLVRNPKTSTRPPGR